jgi:hypothetical protein
VRQFFRHQFCVLDSSAASYQDRLDFGASSLAPLAARATARTNASARSGDDSTVKAAIKLVDGGGWVENGLWPVHSETNDSCGGDRLALVEQEPKALPATDHAEFQGALFVYRTVQPRGNWLGTILRMAGDTDSITAEAFDAVMAALGLDVDHRSARQIRTIDNFSRRHKASLLRYIG